MEESPSVYPAPSATPKRSLMERISSMLLREPEDSEQLVELLHSAHERDLLSGDALSMIEGVLQVSEIQVRDVMIPRSQMDMLDVLDEPADFIPMVIETAHSRFPVFEDNRDNVIGILLAKDLLSYYGAKEEWDMRQMLRPAIFVPEAKRLNVLLREFKENRNHIAIVVDEYGGVAGLVTIEDVLEQIVGDIEDEYDFDETEDDILPEKNDRWRVKSGTEIENFNAHFNAHLHAENVETIGGMVTQAFGHLPKRGEAVSFDGYHFTVLRADSRKILALLVEKIEKPVIPAGSA